MEEKGKICGRKFWFWGENWVCNGYFILCCSVDDGFPAVTFFFENGLSLKVYPHDYLFPSVSILQISLYLCVFCYD